MYYSEMEKEFYRAKEKIDYLLDVINEKNEEIERLKKELENGKINKKN